jgi:penicillin V acylase-like amidase (Ntn superfamily)
MDFLNTVRNNVDFVPRGQKLPMAALGRRIAWKNQYGFIGIHTTLPDKTASGYVDG